MIVKYQNNVAFIFSCLGIICFIVVMDVHGWTYNLSVMDVHVLNIWEFKIFIIFFTSYS